MKASIQKISAELKSYSRAERLFVLFVMLCSMCITSQHAIIKPISYSVFVANFSASWFPYAWLVMMPINLFVVMLYNRLLATWGCFQLALYSSLVVIGIDVLSAYYLASSPALNFFYFIWKDIYILLMFQQLWSVVHSTISSKRAKYLYGIIYGMGGLGSIIGSCIPGFFATKVGSEHLLLVTCLIYSGFIIFYHQMLRLRETLPSLENLSTEAHSRDTSGGFKLIWNSRILKFILTIVVLMQIATTFIDFEFNTHLASLITDKDLRTEYTGKIFGLIHAVNIFLQFFGTFIFIQLLGMKRTHLLVPTLIASNIAGFLVVPAFGLITLCFSLIKAFDYSILTIIKEMLYLPLKVEEKFKAKAVIDVFAHRSSKAIASLAILALQWLHLQSLTSWILLGVFLLWILAVAYMLKKESWQTA